MKKIVGLLLGLVMVFATFTACGGDPIVGEWELTSVSTGGQEYTMEQMMGLAGGDESAEISVTIAINEDGTCAMKGSLAGDSEATDGTWEVTDAGYVFDMDGEGINATIDDDDRLIMESDDAGLIFTKK